MVKCSHQHGGHDIPSAVRLPDHRWRHDLALGLEVQVAKSAHPSAATRHRACHDLGPVTPIRSPSTTSSKSAVGDARCCRSVQRLTGVAYFALISAGNSGRQGTSANGAAPTAVAGSVSSQTYASKTTTSHRTSSAS